MKKKKFIVITTILILISLFFIPSANAMSTSEYNTSLTYSEEALETINTYKNKLNAILDRLETQDTWCRNGLCYKISDGIYAPIIKLNTLSTDSVTVYLSKVDNSSNNNYVSTIYSDNNINDDRIFIQYGQLTITFNFTNDVLSGTSVTGSGNKQYNYYFSASLNPTLANITKTIGDYYFYPEFLSDNVITTFKVWDTSLPNNYYSIPLKVGENIYAPPTTMFTKPFFESFMPTEISVDSQCQTEEIGRIMAPNNFTIFVKEQINNIDDPVKNEIIYYTYNSEETPTDYWNITTYKRNLTGNSNVEDFDINYGTSCEINSEGTYICKLTYYFTTEEEEITAGAQFVFRRNTEYSSDLVSETTIEVKAPNCNIGNVDIQGATNNDITEGNSDNNWWSNITNTLSNIFNFFNPRNLIYLIVPTESQTQNILNEMQESINSKLGLLGLPLTIYTRIMNIANTNTQENWCLTWEAIKVPNFEQFEIIHSGEWCFSTITQNQKIANFRNVCINIIGGLILLAFVQYLNNVYHRFVESPDRDNYEYISTQDIYDVNDDTGELSNHRYMTRTTQRRVKKE